MRSLILLVALAGVLMPATVSTAQNERAFGAAYAGGDWPAAAEAGEIWARREPGNPVAAFNTACALALAGRPEEALPWLEVAGEAGFAGTRSIDEDPDLEAARALPGFETAVARIRSNRAALFSEFRSAADRSRILTIAPPQEATGPRPLIVVLHGYGGKPEPNADLYRGVAARLGALLAAPSAIRPGPGGQGYSWTYRDEAEWWVLRVIERLENQYEVDPERVFLAGFSQGANTALSVALSHPQRFAGVLAVAGHYEKHVMEATSVEKPRVYLLTGDRDASASTFETARRDLAARGLKVRLRRVRGLGHAYPRRSEVELRRAFEFLSERSLLE